MPSHNATSNLQRQNQIGMLVDGSGRTICMSRPSSAAARSISAAAVLNGKAESGGLCVVVLVGY